MVLAKAGHHRLSSVNFKNQSKPTLRVDCGLDIGIVHSPRLWLLLALAASPCPVVYMRNVTCPILIEWWLRSRLETGLAFSALPQQCVRGGLRYWLDLAGSVVSADEWLIAISGYDSGTCRQRARESNSGVRYHVGLVSCISGNNPSQIAFVAAGSSVRQVHSNISPSSAMPVRSFH